MKEEEKFILEDGLFFEQPNTEGFNYSTNNKIYKIDREFIFSYNHKTPLNESVKIAQIDIDPAQRYNPNSFDNAWCFTYGYDKTVITHLSLMATMDWPDFFKEKDNYRQTVTKYSYLNDSSYLPFHSHTGIIENEKNIWLHPFRSKFFKILQLNPYPFIQFPLELNKKWNWKIQVGQQWGNENWKSWIGNIEIKHFYKVLKKESISTNLGVIECWVIQSNAVSELGTSELISYFNNEYGFVKMIYNNIDGSNTIIELEDIK